MTPWALPIPRPRLPLLLLLLVAACGGSPPPLAPLGEDAVILAFGDSLTHGTGAREEESYPEVLSGLVGREVINAGRPGELSGEGLKRLPRELDRHRPDLVILCHGGNDLLRRRPESESRANLAAMVALIKERGIEVVLVGVPDPGLVLSPPALYREVAKDAGVPYEGDVLADVLGDNRLKSDLIHPNAQGYRQMAEALAELLRRAGAL